MKQRWLVPAVFGLMVLLGLQSSFAQGMRRSPEERAKQLKEQISLTDEQTKKVTDILTESQKIVMAKMQEGTGDRSSMQEFIMKETEKVDKKIEALLDEEQMKKYEEFKKQRQQMRRGPRPGQ